MHLAGNRWEGAGPSQPPTAVCILLPAMLWVLPAHKPGRKCCSHGRWKSSRCRPDKWPVLLHVHTTPCRCPLCLLVSSQAARAAKRALAVLAAWADYPAVRLAGQFLQFVLAIVFVVSGRAPVEGSVNAPPAYMPTSPPRVCCVRMVCNSEWQQRANRSCRCITQYRPPGRSHLPTHPPEQALYICATYSPPAPDSLRAQVDLALCGVFALEYLHRMLVRPQGTPGSNAASKF